MEFIVEFIAELILEALVEGGIIVGTDKKVSRWIRYPLLFILQLCCLAVIFLVLYVGIAIFKENVLGSVIIISLGVLMLVTDIVKVIKIYKKTRES